MRLKRKAREAERTNAAPKEMMWMLDVRKIEKGESSLSLGPELVTKPGNFAGAFKAGDRVMELVFQSTNTRQTIAILRNLKKMFLELKQKGYAGIYGDTSNTALINQAEKIGATVISAPLSGKIVSKTAYAVNMLRLKYPKKYLLKPVKRVIIKF